MNPLRCAAKGLGLAVLLMTAFSAHATAARVSLWRLDCGTFVVKDLTNSCYLVKHGDMYLLWDAGFGDELLGHPKDVGTRNSIELNVSLQQQLRQLGLRPRNIQILALSHTHFDHIGQARLLSSARLLLGRQDWDDLVAQPATDKRRSRLEPWIAGRSARHLVTGDCDIFGDASVVMLDTPGHTPGHHSLLVRLRTFGPVLLSGDLYSTTQQYADDSVSPHDTNPIALTSSRARFKQLAQESHATVIIQHEPSDIAKLPAFPAAAR
jgi:N-acyl homoserine lactone hydrolase